MSSKIKRIRLSLCFAITLCVFPACETYQGGNLGSGTASSTPVAEIQKILRDSPRGRTTEAFAKKEPGGSVLTFSKTTDYETDISLSKGILTIVERRTTNNSSESHRMEDLTGPLAWIKYSIYETKVEVPIVYLEEVSQPQKSNPLVIDHSLRKGDAILGSGKKADSDIESLVNLSSPNDWSLFVRLTAPVNQSSRVAAKQWRNHPGVRLGLRGRKTGPEEWRTDLIKPSTLIFYTNSKAAADRLYVALNELKESYRN